MPSKPEYIAIEVIQEYYQVDSSWIDELIDHELLIVQRQAKQRLISNDQLSTLEKMINLNQQLGVNTAGIEVILNLLERLETLQDQVRRQNQRITRLMR